MEKRVLWIRRGCVVLLFFFVFIPHGCDSAKRYAGTYVSVSEGEPSQMETILELKEDDNGVWRTNEKEVPFRWSVKGKEIRLHTKEGGVITGKTADDTITITLPGDKMMTFKKRHTY
jgi:hypothetical protein